MEHTLATRRSPATPTVTPTTSSPSPDRDQTTLHRLLDAELDYSPRATGPYISHLAMSLVAAHRLGADDQVLEAWYRAQTSDDFLVPRSRPTWLEPDTAAIVERGIAATVSEQLPALVGSPSSQFFHAIIRLELAVDAGHAGQVANALRNWGDANTPIGPAPSGRGRSSFAEVLAGLAAADDVTAGSGLDLGRVASSPVFIRTVDDLMASETLLDDVAATVAAHHTEPGNFGSLHLVTGTRAARAVMGFLDGPTATELALRTAQAVAAALVGLGQLADHTASIASAATGRTPASTDASIPWGTINRAAIESGDPHVAKLVYACLLEERATGHPTHRQVAARQVELSPSRT